MRFIKHISFLFLALLATLTLKAQELNCTVSVISPTVQMTNKDIFKAMETSIREFMNNRKWTTDNFSNNERIDCNMLINITGVNGNDFTGTIQVNASRPAYGTNYNSPTFNFIDKNFSVTYVQFQPMEYQEGTYVNELTAVLSYYAYIILGYDYDSFSKMGGSMYFQKANAIVNAAQTSSVTGWSAMDKNDRNRYFLVNELLDERYRSYREAMYTYHRLGLDNMAEDNELGLNKILECLTALETMRKTYPSSFLLQVFFETKANELMDLFSQAPTEQKTKARDILTTIDVINAQKYTDKLK